VLDAESDWQAPGVFELTRDLSNQFACPVLSVVVHDDDLTYYELWNIGERRDSYSSMPGWPEGRGPPEGGNPAELVELMGSHGCDVASVERILRAEHGIGPTTTCSRMNDTGRWLPHSGCRNTPPV
jgi:hypothetical protein